MSSNASTVCTQDIINQIEDTLTCPICFEIFKNPVLLKCGHSFCKQCLKALVTSEANATYIHGLSCPVCRAEFSKEDIDTQQKDFTKTNQLDILNGNAVKLCTICSLINPGKETGVVISTCVTCRFHLCVECIIR